MSDLSLPHGEACVLDAFMQVMRKKLVANRHKSDEGLAVGSPTGWKMMSTDLLMSRVEEEMQEVYKALNRWKLLQPVGGVRLEMGSEALAEECADAANFLMMLADVVGGLK